MESVIDAIIQELQTFAETTSAEGGCEDILTIEAFYFGDPGIIPVNSYPCFTVQADRDIPESETTGYDVRDHYIYVTLLIDSREYWDATAQEATGDRQMVQVMENLRLWLRRAAKRQLDGLGGVRELKIEQADYFISVRDSVVAKSAQLQLLVNRQYARQA